MISGLDLGYPVGEGSDPLLGARLPELELTTPQGVFTSTALLRTGRGLLLDLAPRGTGRCAGPPGCGPTASTW
ncbi:aromatic-ring hydroxylase C-terminal domain-containing protein [Streptacidiphilus sp. PAMC 29251]